MKPKRKSSPSLIEEEEQTQTSMTEFKPAISQFETERVIHYATWTCVKIRCEKIEKLYTFECDEESLLIKDIL